MLNLYNELFHIPKHEKIREKVMLARITVTITIVILCLAAMSFTAYAYFSHSVTSGSSAMKSANFEIKLEITDENGVAVDNSQITSITADYRSFKIEGLTVGKSYTVTIKPTEQSTAMTGFAVLTADSCAKTYHTQQLAKDVIAKGGQTPSLSFKLTITDTTNVYLKAHWGTSSYYDAYKDNGNNGELYITQGEEIKLSIQNNTPAPTVTPTPTIAPTPVVTPTVAPTPTVEPTPVTTATPEPTTEALEATSTPFINEN